MLTGMVSCRKYKDHRTRRDRTEKMNQSWAPQMSDLVDAFMEWRHAIGVSGWNELDFSVVDGPCRTQNIRLVDMFCESSLSSCHPFN